ncbi:sensor domain-containing protein [Jeotgalibacillus terrae]|uniref:EAL domain-containing protein n=1 Tax=Jeotgalibacillus terrae TaxID=587735 RepID=A0ABW5ZKI0_9BACL|nr:EAL domain-containing protein [Jeotgalibacillus terrae]MBM7579961.1 diguanylate cyclase (GGDEF)-like protein/PAS domain S-box-containing protein [Jeotgalibacillus terrae]
MNHKHAFSDFGLNDFKLLLSQIPEPLCIISGDHQMQPDEVICINNQFEALFSVSSEDVSGTKWRTLFEDSLHLPVNEELFTDEYSSNQRNTNVTGETSGQTYQIKVNRFHSGAGKLYFLLMISDETEHLYIKKNLRETSSEFESLFKYNPHIVYTIDEQGLFKNFNSAGLEKLRYSLSEITGLNFLRIVAEGDRERTKGHFLKVLHGEVQHFQIQINDKFGQPLTVEVTAVPIIVDGQVKGVTGTAQDISERLEMESALKRSEESHRAFFDHNIDPVITFDLEGNFLTFNQATSTILNVTQDEIAGESFLPFIEEDLREKTWENFQQVLNGEPYQYETATRNEEGEIIWLHITLIPAFVDHEVHHIHCIGKDITLEKNHHELMHQMAYHDNLTGLGNQQLFNKDIQEKINHRSGESFSLCIIGLDRFKFVNDHFGHEAGDHILSIVSRRIKEAVGDQGKLYRYGGDEFAIISPFCTEFEVNHFINHILLQLGKPFDGEGYDTVVTASAGISFYPLHGSNKQEIVRAADRAMYYAKKQGRNTIRLYSSTIEALTQNHLKMEVLMRKALHENEFTLHYQPQFRADTEEVCGIEALIRWNSKELGMIAPDRLIPIAEETGLIVPIGRWVLEEACKQLKVWERNGFPVVPISVNLSLRQFFQSDLCEMIEKVIEDTGIQPKYLTLEITETIAMQEEMAIGVLDRLKRLGIKIAMDDFGTGYSSLKYLQSFSIDHVKIDKAFTNRLNSKEGRAIISTIIALGHNLDMKVVAEGVETPDQVSALRELGCDIFQGYYFSRPVPAKELESKVFYQYRQ